MRRFCSAIAGVVLVLAVAFSGCSDDSTPAPGSGFLDSGTSVPFKSTDLSQFDGMVGEMKKNVASGANLKKPAAPKGEPKK